MLSENFMKFEWKLFEKCDGQTDGWTDRHGMLKELLDGSKELFFFLIEICILMNSCPSFVYIHLDYLDGTLGRHWIIPVPVIWARWHPKSPACLLNALLGRRSKKTSKLHITGLCEGNSLVTHEGQWRRALMFSLICAWIKGWANNRDASDLRRHRAHYDVTVMETETTMTSHNSPLFAFFS